MIDGALSAALDPVVHISSYGALLPPPPDGRLSPDTPPARGVGAYTTSKADQEHAARARQAQGTPVVTVMPGSVWGPGDPYFGESDKLAADILRGQMAVMPSGGGFPICDVHDIAEPQPASPSRAAGRGATSWPATSCPRPELPTSSHR